jgi:hypothetical protein
MDRYIAHFYVKLLAAIESGNQELIEILHEQIEHLERRLTAIR